MDDISIRTVNLNRISERVEIEMFLKKNELLLEKDVDYTIGVYNDVTVVGTGSLSKNVIKCIAIDHNFQGGGIFNKIASELINVQYQRGNSNIFVFTKPENKKYFIDVGFKEISTVEKKVSLLENSSRGIDVYVEKLKEYKREGCIISSIVMNCNPFTYGHQYLIEKAAANSDIVHIFLVWENRSLFPNDVRLKLIKEGTCHLRNVVIHKGEDYIISNATFPSYFIKEKNSIVETHARLDVKIFAEYIAPSLAINRRYVGEEPNDPVTREYNKVMIEMLPENNIEVIEVPRLMEGDKVISASFVRNAIKEDKIDSLKSLVPISTYRYIVSEEAKPIIEKIKRI
jgi:[citrate (pro-3S)-lyase] ligase